ncbi:hypothetical protein NDK47_24190 [Brevibacillus ruminantium]|uniref:Uncharacterized protein n=1 Tax=Brevibacillus ruminantium TaxID=2950604 RepID=A0ABY4WA10_9BACL|nr:hypothetical protein [Brevibacillus ruminantium]USG64010.1 hypothetical protein NDK47_17830 [Brevibacillus ruminantium]USG65187.1 hypothetical protein NDK47_24190 [Brevibacillus ruminantium]
MLDRLHRLVWRAMVWVSQKKKSLAQKIEDIDRAERIERIKDDYQGS